MEQRQHMMKSPNFVVLNLRRPEDGETNFLGQSQTWSPAMVIVLPTTMREVDTLTALCVRAGGHIAKIGPFDAPFYRGDKGRQRRESDLVSSVFRFGDVVVDFGARRVQKSGAALHLTPIEYRLLGVFIANAGRVLAHRDLLREVWGPSHSEHTHYLRVHLSNLRQKLELEAARPRHILTEVGIGYRFVVEPIEWL